MLLSFLVYSLLDSHNEFESHNERDMNTYFTSNSMPNMSDHDHVHNHHRQHYHHQLSFVVVAMFSLVCMLCFSTSSHAWGEEVFIVTLDGLPGVHKLDSDVKERNGLPMASLEAQAYFAQLEAEHDEFLSNNFEPGSYKKLYSYSHVLNGFAVQIDADKADVLKNLANVRGIERDWELEKFTTHTPDFLGLPDSIWPREGGPSGAGEGIIIGILDTGIDPSHPSFSVTGSIPYPPLDRFHGKCEQSIDIFCNGKIVAAQHFSAAAQAAGAFNSSNNLASPLDGDGHGSHIASIAAGNHGVLVNYNGFYFGDASGMAPRARISSYKALYGKFGGFVSDIVAAIDQAAKDGVHVLSLSVGPSSPPSSTRLTFLNAFDVALLSAVKSGVFVVQAAGNAGPYPRTMASFSPWIMSVAAGLDDRRYTNSIYLGNGVTLSGIGLAPGTLGDQMYDLVLADDVLLKNSGINSNSPLNCQQPESFDKTLVQGKILICTYSFSFVYGAASVRRVADTARNLSAAGFILFAKTNLPGNKFNPVPLAIPGIVITDLKDSMTLINYYNTSKTIPQAKLGNGMSPTLLEGRAPQVAAFSSRGPCVKDFSLQDADVLKPNIVAPGFLIWGAWTPMGTDEADDFQGQEFALMSGTSMATPHVAGVAALILQAHPDWSPAAVASAMMTTASILDKQGFPLLAQHYATNGSVVLELATPFDFGSGALNATAAIDPGLVFDAGYEDYINFLCAMSELVDQETQILNATGSSCDTKEKQRRPVDLNSPSITISNMMNSKTIMRTVTNVGGGTETYTVSLSEPSGIAMEVTPNSFTIPTGGSVSLAIELRVVSPASSFSAAYTYGSILLTGDQNHLVRMPLAIRIGTS